jgi:bacteriocin biosynthesis cyclodehydratase domain-containing protein
LIEEGQLEPEAYVPAEYLAQHQEQLTFFGHFHQQPLRAQQHLYTSRVTLLDDGTAYGPQLASALAATGPGELRLVNAADQGWLELANRTLDDVAAPEELARQLAEQQPFSQISAHRLSYEWVPSPTEITPPRGTDQTYQALTPLTNGASLVVVLTEGYSSRLCDIVNELALKEGFRWLNVSLKGSRVYVGPGIVPHTTACWLCYHSRVWANQVQPNTPYGIFEEAEQAYHTHATRRTFGQLPAVTNLAAALGANEIVKALTLYSQALYGSVLAFDAFNNRSQTYEVLRLPRCKACGRDRVRVPMKLWHTSRPVVRSING